MGGGLFAGWLCCVFVAVPAPLPQQIPSGDSILTVLADHYLHHATPILIQFTEKIAIRWYGLAYVLGFVGGFVLLLHLVRKKCSELRTDQVGDFITYTAIFGVMLGGRLGYMLFYDFSRFVENPLIFFNFLSGGMASHGGILGIVFFTLFFAWRHKLSWAGLGDNLVVVAPIGLFLGRCANYINGELYGRITTVSWAMKFPTEMSNWSLERIFGVAQRCAAASDGFAAEYASLQAARLEGSIPNDGALAHRTIDALSSSAQDQPGVAAILQEVLPARHPSQLYEAALEGLVLFAILLLVRLRWPNLRHGILTGLFFVLYAVFRISVEFFREPDHGQSQFGALTRGQFYSAFMIVIGIGFFVYAWRFPRRNRLPGSVSKQS